MLEVAHSKLRREQIFMCAYSMYQGRPGMFDQQDVHGAGVESAMKTVGRDELRDSTETRLT